MSSDFTRKEKLTRSEVDVLAEKTGQFLEKSDLDRATLLRTRLVMEDMILSVCETLGEDIDYTFETGRFLGQNYIRFSYKGDAFDPGVDSDDPSAN